MMTVTRKRETVSSQTFKRKKVEPNLWKKKAPPINDIELGFKAQGAKQYRYQLKNILSSLCRCPYGVATFCIQDQGLW